MKVTPEKLDIVLCSAEENTEETPVINWSAVATGTYGQTWNEMVDVSGCSAAIAREIADITIAAENLFELVALRRIAQGLMSRINSNYRFVIGFNGSLIGLGVAGVLAPATSAMMHNLSTLGISLRSMTNLIDSSETTRLLESR